jgi:hypothetical protein
MSRWEMENAANCLSVTIIHLSIFLSSATGGIKNTMKMVLLGDIEADNRECLAAPVEIFPDTYHFAPCLLQVVH